MVTIIMIGWKEGTWGKWPLALKSCELVDYEESFPCLNKKVRKDEAEMFGIIPYTESLLELAGTVVSSGRREFMKFPVFLAPSSLFMAIWVQFKRTTVFVNNSGTHFPLILDIKDSTIRLHAIVGTENLIVGEENTRKHWVSRAFDCMTIIIILLLIFSAMST